MAGKRYLSPKEVAARFNVTPRTVRRWWQSGKTCLKAWHPHHSLGKRGLQFTVESVEEFKRAGEVLPGDGDGAAEA